ncbi:hypothetical protein QJS10_CPB17g02197 [Acorus calamus]|uniref:Uncharacterized protein n=1 Tax=Acorus calamus TaxID=4465 RepID=A0AAV9CSL8_ACOCL|nr:hypothetical protein QJS10_CPB17g02197 [Acorus calamus]
MLLSCLGLSRLQHHLPLRLNQVRSLMQAKEQVSVRLKNKAKPDEKVDIMTESFGEAYASRCDEEGFGGIYKVFDEKVDSPEEENTLLQDHQADEGNKKGKEAPKQGGEKGAN